MQPYALLKYMLRIIMLSSEQQYSNKQKQTNKTQEFDNANHLIRWHIHRIEGEYKAAKIAILP
jgi:hypothetical protein